MTIDIYLKTGANILCSYLQLLYNFFVLKNLGNHVKIAKVFRHRGVQTQSVITFIKAVIYYENMI